MGHQLRYHPCADQRALAETFNASLKGLLPLSRLHASLEESVDTWAQLDAIGLFDITRSEAAGGSGLGAAEEALIVMELGRCLAAPSVLASIGASHVLTGGNDRRGGLPRTAAAYRQGGRVILAGDSRATRFLLRDAGRASLHRMPATSTPIDGQLWQAQLVEIAAADIQDAAADSIDVVRLRLNDAAALTGMAEATLAMAVGYAGERKQFGRVIGSFQAIKHHCANMAIAARSARDQTGFASIAIDDGRPEAPLHVDYALLVSATAALQNAAMNIQIHGGIGFSEEAFPHLFLKRAQLLVAFAGGLEEAISRIADASPIARAG